ncbi:MAG: hypothetical protein ACLFRV_02605 [Acidimicrobiales bacterium]
MPRYQITLIDESVECIDGADAYLQEGQMTTFFATDRRVVDSWSTRLASFRTADIRAVRRLDHVLATGVEPTRYTA